MRAYLAMPLDKHHSISAGAFLENESRDDDNCGGDDTACKRSTEPGAAHPADDADHGTHDDCGCPGHEVTLNGHGAILRVDPPPRLIASGAEHLRRNDGVG